MPIDYSSVNSIMRKYLKRGEFARPETERKYAPSLEFEPTHQTINLNFEIAEQKAEGFVETQLTAKTSSASIIKYDAINLFIKNVEGPDEWHYDGIVLTCKWKNPLSKGDTTSTKVFYSVDHPISGLYFSNPDEFYPDRPRYAVTDVESIRARYWLPCVDHLSVRCTLDFFLTSDKEHTILANGKCVSEEALPNGKKMVHWSLDFPCPSYLITLAVGEFIEYKDRDADTGKGHIPVAYYTTKNYTVENLGKSFSGTPDFIEWMVKKFSCPLEWPKYYQIATALHGGAMENISLVTWGDFAIMDERERAEFKWLVDWINVHELSHSWFGDMIVCNDFAHAWLKESWATYVEKLYYEDSQGIDAYLYGMYEDRCDYMKESDERYARPIVTKEYESSWDMYDKHLYPGGSFRLHMLRNIIGDSAFFEAVSDYLNTFKGKTVETIDFQRKLEFHSGMNLQPFFDQWLFSRGYPQLKADFSYEDKSQLVKIRISQNQVDEKAKIGVFKFPLVIEWETAEGELKRQTFQINEKDQTCYFKCEHKPLRVQLDPDFHLLFSLEFNPGQDLLFQQLMKGNLIGKIFAAQELAKIGNYQAILAISEQYKKETFWGIKVEFLKSLLSIKNYHAIEKAVEILSNEKDPQALFHSIGELEGKRHQIVVNMIKSFINRSEYYYHSTGNALKVLGSQRSKEMWEYLSSLTLPADYNNILKGYQFEAIGKLRLPDSVDYLKEKIRYGKSPENIRRQVIKGIVDALTWAKKEIKEEILEIFQVEIERASDETFLIQIAFAIQQLRLPRSRSLLIALKSRISTQFHPRLEKLIKSLEKSENSAEASKQQTEKIDKLEKMMEKLISRVEILEQKVNLAK
ncbi:M1 family aminopeptidase [Candidatus Harpocratesius sp.]